MEIGWTTGISSEQVIERCIRGVRVTDYTNPASPATTTLNWITAGYADTNTLNADGKPSLTMTIKDQTGNVATIFQLGLAVSALNVPFIILAVAPTVPILIYNRPRVPGTYSRTIVFTKPNGEATGIEESYFTVEAT